MLVWRGVLKVICLKAAWHSSCDICHLWIDSIFEFLVVCFAFIMYKNIGRILLYNSLYAMYHYKELIRFGVSLSGYFKIVV